MKLLPLLLVALLSRLSPLDAGPLGAGAEAASAPWRLQFCLAAAADRSPVYPTGVFLSGAREMSAVWRLLEGEAVEKLTAVWIAADVGGAAPANYEIARLDQPLQGQKKGRFRYSQPNPLPAGKYRLEVLADGKPWDSVECSVVPDGKPIEVQGPAALFPLAEGRTWNYDFLLQAGSGAKVSLPGVQPDPEGKLRARVAIVVGKTEPAGTHIEISRNGEVVFEEWWRVDAAGLASTQRGAAGSITRLDPAQVLWSLPLEAHKSWQYEASDGSFLQTYEQWGPLPVKGPRGDAPGYIVLVEQATPLGKTTVERHFIPGFGLVREVIITSAGANLASRQELTLAAGGGEAPAKARGPGPPPVRKFETDFTAALERARKEGKVLLCEFYSTTCPYCKKMETAVYPEPEIAELSARLVWVRLDQGKDEGGRLVQELKGGATPTYMAIGHDGKTVYYRFSDALGKEGFLHNLSLITFSPEEYRKAAENPEARLPTAEELLVLAKGALVKGEIDGARRTLEGIVAKDPGNASGLADDALVLWGSVENAAWTDEGAKKAREIWTRVVNDFPTSDRAADAVFFLAGLFREVGPKDGGQALESLLAEYPRGVDVARARKIIGGQ